MTIMINNYNIYSNYIINITNVPQMYLLHEDGLVANLISMIFLAILSPLS